MAFLTLRQVKGDALTHVELDANFTALDSDIQAGVFDSGITVSDGISVEGGIDINEGDLTLRDGDIYYNPKLGFIDLVAGAERARIDSNGSFLVGSSVNSQSVNYKFARVGGQHVLTGNKTSNSGQTTRQELGPAGDGTETGVGLLATQATTNFNDWTMDLFVSNSVDGYINAISIDQFGETTFNEKVIFADSAEFQKGLNVTGGDILVNGVPIAGGSVSSVGMTAPTGFTVTGSPITNAGTLAVGYAAAYTLGLPSNTKQGQWDQSFSWGDHSLEGYVNDTRTINTSNGIQGGGNLTADRTLQLDGTYTGDFEVTGNLLATQDVIAFGTVSDLRKKTEISTIENALEKVSTLRGINFTYRESGLKSTGLIAQDLQKVLPEAVFETDDKGHLGVRYAITVGLLVEAIKELKSEIEELKSR